jgi:hypothetical protein
MLMSWKDQIIKAGSQKPLSPRIVVYGPPGIGKSTFGSTLPDPIFIDFDKGADDIKVDRVSTPKSWTETLDLVRSVAISPSGYKSIVVDTLDPLEELTIAHVEKNSGMSFQKMNNNYGAGYSAVGVEWKLFLADLDACRRAGMLVCLLAHARVRTVQDPQLGAYDGYTPCLGSKSWSQTEQWADIVGFTTFDAAVAKSKNDERVIVTGDRLLWTTRGTGFIAKNRYGIITKMPLSWKALDNAITTHRGEVNVLKARIAALAASMPADVQAKAQDYVLKANDDVYQLRATLAGLELKAETLKQETPQAPVAPATLQEVKASGSPKTGRDSEPSEVTNTKTLLLVATPQVGVLTLPTPAQEPSRSSPEAIEQRITKLAAGTPMAERARELIAKAGKDLKILLTIEENLTKKLSSNSAPSAGA